ncbi:hypothetical protein IM40_07370 [Candidatus Paracaedimonas acanthamoebae]|nr:hypothetical protein IM40_07370 [Candidatus Paracaedimonas acanthamoebae]
MPQDAYMRQHGIKTNDGIAMMMEQPTPGKGGRHRQTRTYGKQPELRAAPRTVLARDIQDLRQIYKKDDVYTPEIKQGLQDVIQKNKEKFPDLFKKATGE